MSTRSFIGKLNQNGTVDYIYCHWDGYCAGTGYILLAHADEQAVDDLLAEGWLSSIDWSEAEGLCFANLSYPVLLLWFYPILSFTALGQAILNLFYYNWSLKKQDRLY